MYQLTSLLWYEGTIGGLVVTVNSMQLVGHVSSELSSNVQKWQHHAVCVVQSNLCFVTVCVCVVCASSCYTYVRIYPSSSQSVPSTGVTQCLTLMTWATGSL